MRLNEKISVHVGNRSDSSTFENNIYKRQRLAGLGIRNSSPDFGLSVKIKGC